LELTGDSKARAACLPTAADVSSYTAAGTKFVVSGWGTTKQGGDQPDVLHSAVVPHISDAVCSAGQYSGQITNQMMCAGHLAGGIDSCQGDSGGPLTWVNPSTSKVTLVGVVSWGFGCAQPNLPGVYAEVTSVLSWMNNYIPADCLPSTAAPTTTNAPNPTTTNAPNPTTTIAPNPTTTNVPETTTTIAPSPTTPNVPETTTGTTGGGCSYPEWVDDKYCDDGNNNAECNWDGGDCCAESNPSPDKDFYCDDCLCLDPNPPCKDQLEQWKCERIERKGKCDRQWALRRCAKTCGACGSF